jgi:hypothetical protein
MNSPLEWVALVVIWVVIAVIGVYLIRSWMTVVRRGKAPTKGKTRAEVLAWMGTHWKKIAFWILISPIVITLIAPFIVRAWLAAWDYGINDTHPAEWGVLPKSTLPQPPPKPKGKNVGGLLQWSNNTNVKPRTRATTETLNASNAAFVGVFPPASYADVTFVAYNENNVPWRAFLIDYTSMRSFPSAQLLNTRATSKAQARDVAMVELPELPQKGRLEKRIQNTLPNAAAGLMECYIELVGGPSSIHLDIKEPSDTFQYEVEVGAEGISIFEIPACKYFWVVPVDHQDYQSRFFQYAVPPQGMCIKKATELMEAQRLVQRPDLMGKGYEQTQSFQAVLINHRGTTSALSEAVGFQGVDVRGASIDLRLNIPTDDEILKQVTKPARVIVGYQL